MTVHAQPARIPAPVEHRAPKTFVRSGPVSPAANAKRGDSAPYTGHRARVGRSDVLAKRPFPAPAPMLFSRYGRFRDQSAFRAILYHGRTEPRAYHGRVAPLDADDEGDTIADGIWHGSAVACLTMGCGRNPQGRGILSSMVGAPAPLLRLR